MVRRTSLPTPSAPSAAAVKLVAMEKKSTSPPSRAARMQPISVPGTLAQLTTRSKSAPPGGGGPAVELRGGGRRGGEGPQGGEAAPGLQPAGRGRGGPPLGDGADAHPARAGSGVLQLAALAHDRGDPLGDLLRVAAR